MSSECLTIYTCANGPYQSYAPVYIAAALWSNPGCHVEIGLESLDEFDGTRLGDAMMSTFGEDNYTLKIVPWTKPSGGRIKPNSVRFITEPKNKSEYVYIGDIDLLTLRTGILDLHLGHMQRTGLQFSNGVRKNTKRLTGLHFAHQSFQYPVPDVTDLIETPINDEVLLYKIVERNMACSMPEFEFFRPQHGIHFSPNRAPWGREVRGIARPGWNITPWAAAWEKFRESRYLNEILPYLKHQMSSIIHQIDLAVSDPDESKRIWRENPFLLEGGRSNLNR